MTTPSNDCESCEYVRTEKIGSQTLHLFVCRATHEYNDEVYTIESCIVRWGDQPEEYSSWPTTMCDNDVEAAFKLLLACHTS